MSIDIEAIRARAEAATRGPWKVMWQGNTVPSLQVVNEVFWENPKQIKVCSSISPKREADADFISHAREDIPALLAEVKRLQGELDAEHEGLKNILSTSVPKLESEIAKSVAINKVLHEQIAAVTAERDEAVMHMKIIADTYRENVGDDGICGLCEYDAYHGIEGYANECPGFESNECFSWRGVRKEQNDGK